MGDLLSSLPGSIGESVLQPYYPDFQFGNPFESSHDLPSLPDVTKAFNGVIQPLSCNFGSSLNVLALADVLPQTKANDKSAYETLFELGLSVAIGLITSGRAQRMMKAMLVDAVPASALRSGFLTLAKSSVDICVGMPAWSAAFFTGTRVMIQGTGMGALAGFAKSWFGDESDWGKSIIDYGLMGFASSLGPLARSLGQLFAEGRIAVEVAREASFLANCLDGVLSGSVSSTVESVRTQLRDEDKTWGEISWSEALINGAKGMVAGAALGGVLPLASKGAGFVAGKVLKEVPRVPSPIQVRRQTEEVLNSLHELVHQEGAELAGVQTQARALLDGVSHLTEEALVSAGLTRSVLREVREIVDEGSELSRIKEVVTGRRMRAAKDAMITYIPDEVGQRSLPGAITSCRAEGVRPIPKALREDPTFIGYHPNGDFDAQLTPENQIKVTEYLLEIRLGEKGSIRDLDDDTLKELLRFFGYNCRSEESWAEHLAWARKSDELFKMDWDDAVADQLRPAWNDSLQYLSGLVTALASPLQLLPGFKGGVSMLSQARPIPHLVLSALKHGGVASETDSIPELLCGLAQLFPTHRMAFFGKLPYQNITLKEVMESGFCKTAARHIEGLKGLLAKLTNEKWDNLTDELKDAVAIIVNDGRGYKLKLPALLDFIPGLSKVRDRLDEIISIDNAAYYVRNIALQGRRAIQTLDRKMSALGGNWLTGDTFGGTNLWARTTPLRRYARLNPALDALERFTNYFGGTNQLPSEAYGVWHYLFSAAEEMERDGLKLVRFETSQHGTFGKLVEQVYKQKPHNGMAPGGVVQRGYLWVTLKSLFRDLVARVKECKRYVDEIEHALSLDVDASGVSALQKARLRFAEIQARQLAEKVYADIPRAQTASMKLDDLDPLWVRLRRHARYILTGVWQSPNSSTSLT